MKAVVLKKIGEEPEYTEVPTPAVKEDDDILIKIERTGVCYRDLLTVDGFFPKVNLPLILGHEIAGVVVDVGKRVRTVEVGDRVVSLHTYHVAIVNIVERAEKIYAGIGGGSVNIYTDHMLNMLYLKNM